MEANARLNAESPSRTAYSRLGRVGEVASDIGRPSGPSSVLSVRNVNCVGRKENQAGLFSRMSWVEGVSLREATTVVSSASRSHPLEATRGAMSTHNAATVYLDGVRHYLVTSCTTVALIRV